MASGWETAHARFWSKVVKGGGDGCWLWTGSQRNGYGYFAVAPNVGRMAHVFAWNEVHGEVPRGRQLDHVWPRCQNRACVRPDHLEPVTASENRRRAAARNRSETCGKGHPLSGDNLYVRPDNGGRICRECGRRAAREYQRRKRQHTRK